MAANPLRDPDVRRAYVLTKVAVFALAAAATWPLSKVFGPRAWIGLGVFGAILAGLAVAILGIARGGAVNGDALSDASSGDGSDGEDDEPEHPPDTVAIPIEDSLDLHPFPPRVVPDVVDSYLTEAQRRGFREVRIIHGRGIGVQRERVRSLLASHPLVVEHFDAPPDRGGWGATIAIFRRE